MLLKKVVEWDVIDRMPCTVWLLPIAKPSVGLYDFDGLVAAAKMSDPKASSTVLLGGEPGLPFGEIIALQRSGIYVGFATVRVDGPRSRGGAMRRSWS